MYKQKKSVPSEEAKSLNLILFNIDLGSYLLQSILGRVIIVSPEKYGFKKKSINSGGLCVPLQHSASTLLVFKGCMSGHTPYRNDFLSFYLVPVTE